MVPPACQICTMRSEKGFERSTWPEGRRTSPVGVGADDVAVARRRGDAGADHHRQPVVQRAAQEAGMRGFDDDDGDARGADCDGDLDMVVMGKVAPTDDDVARLHLLREFRAQAAEAHRAQCILVELLPKLSRTIANSMMPHTGDVVAEDPGAAARGHASISRGSTMRPAIAEAATVSGPARNTRDVRAPLRPW